MPAKTQKASEKAQEDITEDTKILNEKILNALEKGAPIQLESVGAIISAKDEVEINILMPDFVCRNLERYIGNEKRAIVIFDTESDKLVVHIMKSTGIGEEKEGNSSGLIRKDREAEEHAPKNKPNESPPENMYI